MIDFRKLYNTYDREDLINTCVNLKHSKERLSKEVNKSYIVCDEKDKEIERLNNIINGLEKWLKEDLKQVYRDAGCRHNLILEVLDKLQELKEGEKSEKN